MKPERALTISRALAFNWEHDDESLSVLADRIRDAILQACAEEREACAKIADAQKYGAGLNMVTGILSCGCAKAIRSRE